MRPSKSTFYKYPFNFLLTGTEYIVKRMLIKNQTERHDRKLDLIKPYAYVNRIHGHFRSNMWH